MINLKVSRPTWRKDWWPIGWTPETDDTYVPHEWEWVEKALDYHRCPKCNCLFHGKEESK